MSPRHMELFVAVMTSRTLMEAAERLHISQPAVTKAVQQLEQEMGLALFERTHARVSPTAAAVRLLPYVRRSLREFLSAQRMAMRLAAEAAGHVSVASTTASVTRLLPLAARRLRERFPRTTLEIVPQATATQVLDLVLRKEVDFGIAQKPSNEVEPDTVQMLTSRTLCEHPLSVVLPAGHPLTRCSVVRATDLRDEGIVRTSSEFRPADLIEDAFRDADVPLRIVAQAGTSLAVCGFVQAGLGIGLINPLQVCADVFGDLVLRPFSPKIIIRTSAHFLTAAPLSSSASYLVECLTAIGSETAQQA